MLDKEKLVKWLTERVEKNENELDKMIDASGGELSENDRFTACAFTHIGGTYRTILSWINSREFDKEE